MPGRYGRYRLSTRETKFAGSIDTEYEPPPTAAGSAVASALEPELPEPPQLASAATASPAATVTAARRPVRGDGSGRPIGRARFWWPDDETTLKVRPRELRDRPPAGAGANLTGPA